jgi:hypothetical protein
MFNIRIKLMIMIRITLMINVRITLMIIIRITDDYDDVAEHAEDVNCAGPAGSPRHPLHRVSLQQ